MNHAVIKQHRFVLGFHHVLVRLFQKGVQHRLGGVHGHGVLVLQRLTQRHVHAQLAAVLNGQQKFGQFVGGIRSLVFLVLIAWVCADARAQLFRQMGALQILAQGHQPVAGNGELVPARQNANRALHRQKRLHAGKEVELVV